MREGYKFARNKISRMCNACQLGPCYLEFSNTGNKPKKCPFGGPGNWMKPVLGPAAAAEAATDEDGEGTESNLSEIPTGSIR